MKKLILALFFLSPMISLAEPNCSDVADKGSYFNFTKSCFRHDVCYSEGPAINMSKSACDKRFHSHMQASCGNNLECLVRAYVYYNAVASFPLSVYTNASQKGVKLLKAVEAANDTDTKNLLLLRANNQIQWTKMNDYCSSLSSTQKTDCLVKLRAIVVPNIPNKYKINNCNTLGIRWTNGDRLSNASYASQKTGVPIETILTKGIPDPCAGLYW